jgi:hypothetical protein
VTGGAFAFCGGGQLLSGFGQQFGMGGLDPFMSHAQQMCMGGNPFMAAMQQQVLQLVAGLVQWAVSQLMCGGMMGGMNGWQPQKLDGKEGGGWLAPHGGYKKNEDGSYAISKGAYAGHTAVHMGNGQFGVFAAGCIVGMFQSPTKTEKIASPLTFDLNGDGKVGTTGIENGRKFDLNGDGKLDQTAWAGKGDGVLTFDRDGDGVAGADGRELLGDNTDVDGDGKADGHANGFQALRALAEKHLGKAAVADGKLDAKEIKALEDKAGLRMNVDGVMKKPSELGITSLSLNYAEAGRNADANGNEHRQLGSFTINGQERQANDVWFRYR